MPGRILVVDDDSGIREFVTMTLADEGHDVMEAEHGAAALHLVGEFQPDLILLDMYMPILDGLGFSAAYQKMPPPHAPVIVLSASRDVADLARQVGASCFLAKPFNIDDLLTIVEQCWVGE